MHSQLYCTVVLYTPIIPVVIHPVATISFSPQNYTLQEGYLIELTIVLDRPFSCVDSQTGSHKTFAVTTRDGTAKCEWKVLLCINNTVQQWC